VHDPALLDVLTKLRAPSAREVAKLVKKIEKLGARADVLQELPESAKTDTALDRLAERCDALDQTYYAMSAAFLAEVEAELAESGAEPLKRARKRARAPRRSTASLTPAKSSSRSSSPSRARR
jgi:hypothetical protein